MVSGTYPGCFVCSLLEYVRNELLQRYRLLLEELGYRDFGTIAIFLVTTLFHLQFAEPCLIDESSRAPYVVSGIPVFSSVRNDCDTTTMTRLLSSLEELGATISELLVFG